MADEGPDRWALLGMGTTIAGCLVLPMVLGWVIDHVAGTLPIFVLVGLVLGMITAARYTWAQASRFFGD